MKNRNMIILIILIILVLLSFNLFRNLFKNEIAILDDVKLKEEEPSNNGFALMIETENADGTTSYVESNSNTWPTDMAFNSELSGCIDVNGNKIDNALSFNTSTNTVMVSTNQTAYCYVYFDLKHTLADEIMNNSPAGFNTTLEGGLYRYQGTSVDNYICFGTSDKDTCINNTDKYMYRIIGIDENNQMKLIKNTSIGTKAWNSEIHDDISWSESDLYKGLNGIDGGYYTNIFVNSSTYAYMEEYSNWYNKIATTSWKYGDTKSEGDYNGVTMYTIENGWSNTVNAKIGLMYIHDYYYAHGVGGNPGSYSNAKTAWIFLGNSEWTMSRSGVYSEDEKIYQAWYIVKNGVLRYYGENVGSTLAVRPVFFLENNVEFLSGTGTSDDPILIKE